ncbi:MAG: hypothetical protein DRN37_02175 [Thermoplasmata archaeon]|nr:MAG: hypothetical protein DRN37_02175 [Thermoplasmata archaeon]
MSAYWKLRRWFTSIKRRIRFSLDSSKRREKKLEGLPVYFEDTGERVGVVRRIICNSLGDIIGYEIEDERHQRLYFPSDAFEKTRRGLIFAPLWYSEGLKLVAELEAKTKVPDVHEFILQGLDRDALYERVASGHPEIRRYVQEILSLKEALIKRMNDLEVRVIKLRKELVDLSGKRLLKEMGRREFAEHVIEARREMNITEVSIARCRELLMRINSIPFLPGAIEGEPAALPLRKMLSVIPISMVIVDENGVIINANEHVESNFGYTSEELKNRKLTELVVERDRECISGANRNIFMGSDDEEVEFEFIDKYGVHHLLYGRFTGMDSNGGRMSILAFHTREEEKGLRKIFSERVAHLFLNPLSIAQGYLHLLSEGGYGEFTDEQKKQLHAIENSLLRMERLVRETIKLRP